MWRSGLLLLCAMLGAASAQAMVSRQPPPAAASPATARRHPPPVVIRTYPTASQLLKVWESRPPASEEVRALDRVFPDEMTLIAQTAINKARSGASDSEITAYVTQARVQLLRDKVWLAALAPDDRVKAYVDLEASILLSLQQTNTDACAASAMGGQVRGPSAQGLAQLTAAQVDLMAAGLAKPVKHEPPSTEDTAALVAASKAYGLSSADAGAVLTGAVPSLPRQEQCRIAVGLAQGMRDLPEATSTRLAVAVLASAAQPPASKVSADQIVMDEWRKDAIVGSAMLRLASAMPDETNDMIAAMTERLKAGDARGGSEVFETRFRALLGQNMAALAAAPDAKLEAVAGAYLEFFVQTQAADPHCGFDNPQAPLPDVPALNEANRRLAPALVDALLAGRQRLAAPGDASTQVLRTVTEADRRAVVSRLHALTDDRPLLDAILHGGTAQLPPTARCQAQVLVLRAIASLPRGIQSDMTADFLKRTYQPGA